MPQRIFNIYRCCCIGQVIYKYVVKKFCKPEYTKIGIMFGSFGYVWLTNMVMKYENEFWPQNHIYPLRMGFDPGLNT